MSSNDELVEVFRRDTNNLDKEKSYYYVHVTSENIIGGYQSSNPKQYFARDEELIFVGKFIERQQFGRGDGATILIIFDLDTVELNYEGTTCFLEIDLPDGARIVDRKVVFDK
jgi:hypothetical protein